MALPSATVLPTQTNSNHIDNENNNRTQISLFLLYLVQYLHQSILKLQGYASKCIEFIPAKPFNTTMGVSNGSFQPMWFTETLEIDFSAERNRVGT
jgi:hypothetical protein